MQNFKEIKEAEFRLIGITLTQKTTKEAKNEQENNRVDSKTASNLASVGG